MGSAILEGGSMGQKEVLNQSPVASEVFVELHIDDLVKDRLLWQEQVGRRAYPSDTMPSVIHIVGSRLSPLR
jgi:hypothetical protein